MKLSKRFITIPLVLALFAYLFYTSYKDVKDRTLNEFNIQQLTLAKQSSRGIESFFIYYQRELSFLSKHISDLNDQGKNLLTDFYLNHSDQIEAITIVDEKGILRFTYPLNPDAIGKNISYQPHVKTVIETHQPTVSDVFTAVQGYKAIAYHIPIIINNEYKGSMGILIPLEKLGKRFVENIRTGESGYGWMMSADGIELFNPLENRTGESVKEIYKKMPSALDLFQKTLTTAEGTTTCQIIKPGSKNEKAALTIATFYRVTLGNTFWTLIIFTPEKEIYSKLTSFRNRLYLLIFLIILVMSTYFYLALKASSVLREEKKRKAIEKTLVESEKRFRVMFELSPAGIILVDDTGEIIEVNSSFCENLGYSRKELIGYNVRLFAAPSDESEIGNNISKILSGKTIIHEVRNIKKDGTFCIVALYETGIILPDGTHGILAVSNDISEKKRSQERMHTLSKALESISECVTITDLGSKIIFVNNAFCKCYGYGEEEILGKNIECLRTVNFKEPLIDVILSDTITGAWNGELINIRKNGTEFPIELSTSHIVDEKGSPVALIGIAVDISERKKIQTELIRAKEKAEESDKLKSAFLANMSHELRTPLNAVIGFSGLIIDSQTEGEAIPYAEIILKSGQHLLSLVEDIFDITMIESGQIKINNEKAEVTSILNEVKDIIYGDRLRENKTNIEIKLNLDSDDRVSLLTDSRKLKQVLINLLRNALKFTDNGLIEFGYNFINTNGDIFLQFYVKDTGIGIDKSYHDAIFNIFRQIDDTHTRKFGGMGIGLAIAKKTVEIMGGKIWVESEPAKGSVFYFTIPFLSGRLDNSINEDGPENKQENNQVIKAKDMGKNFEGKTILIAEDERSNFDFLKILFTRMNIRVLWAQDGLEAINFCETDPTIDLVLMDIKMPLLNGFEATRAIKLKRPDLPVIAQTAYAMLSDKKDAENAGCDGYLSKPIKIKQITEILEKFLK